MNVNIAICDDESIICRELSSLIKKHKPDYNICIFNSGTALLDSGKAFDIILLDIEMPGIDGMKTAKLLRETYKDTYIVFITSHIEVMPEAFKVRAFRFINKPVDENKIVEMLSDYENELFDDETITFNEKGTVQIVRVSDIVCFEAFGDGTFIYTKENFYETSKPLKYWTDTLNKGQLFQVHKSYSVALRYVRTVEKTSVVMNYMKVPVPVSRRRMSEFRTTFFDYVKSNSKIL